MTDEVWHDCPKCDGSDSISANLDYDQATISVDGDNLEFTIESEPCERIPEEIDGVRNLDEEECGATLTLTAYATVHHIQAEEA